MLPKLKILGSIGTLIDTSELQRDAFNTAFSQHGLDWNWSQQIYQTLLQRPGGHKRIIDYAHVRSLNVDATLRAFGRHVEDTEACMLSAIQAGIAAISFPNINTGRSVFDNAHCMTDTLKPSLFALSRDSVAT